MKSKFGVSQIVLDGNLYDSKNTFENDIPFYVNLAKKFSKQKNQKF